MKIDAKRGEVGFSLVELLVAMTITLIVSGAIYGLLASGQNAFRREPELSDRQQNIRTAMDLIMRDVDAAGVGMPTFVQTFTQTLDGSDLGACTACPMGPNGVKVDELEMFGNLAGFEAESTCHYPGGSAANIRLSPGATFIRPGQTFLVFLADGTWTIKTATDVGANNNGAGSCANGTPHTQIDLNSGSPLDTGNFNVPGGICGAGSAGTASSNTTPGCAASDCNSATPTAGCCCPIAITQGEVIRYRIRPGADAVPNLERLASHDMVVGNPAAGWQVIARGVEDLQVEYLQAGDPLTWFAGAPAVDIVAQLNYNTLITQVRVTLAARSEARNVQGITPAAALRGSLTSTAAVRSALYNLSALPRPVTATGTTWK